MKKVWVSGLSSPALPSAALMPPSAAPEWLRVGMQLGDDTDVGAVPRCLDGGAHAGEACADHHHVVSHHHRLRRNSGWSKHSEPTKPGLPIALPGDRTSGILDGRGRGLARCSPFPGGTLGEDGLCAAGRAARASQPAPARLQERTAQMPNAAPHRLRRPERADGVLARSKASTFIVSDDAGGRAAPGYRPRRVGACLARRRTPTSPSRTWSWSTAGSATIPDHRVPARLSSRRRTRTSPACRTCSTSTTARTDGFEPELVRHLHAQPAASGLPERPPDRGRPRSQRHPRLQLRLLRRVEEGRAADVEQARPRARRPGAARRLQGDPDAARRAGRPDRRPLGHRQDHDDLHAPERLAAGAGRLRRLVPGRHGQRDRGRLLRQDLSRSAPKTSRPSTAPSTKPAAYLENVCQDASGTVDFFDERYTKNGRAVFSFAEIEAADALAARAGATSC